VLVRQAWRATSTRIPKVRAIPDGRTLFFRCLRLMKLLEPDLRNSGVDVHKADRVRGTNTNPQPDVPNYYISRHTEILSSIIYLLQRVPTHTWSTRGQSHSARIASRLFITRRPRMKLRKSAARTRLMRSSQAATPVDRHPFTVSAIICAKGTPNP